MAILEKCQKCHLSQFLRMPPNLYLFSQDMKRYHCAKFGVCSKKCTIFHISAGLCMLPPADRRNGSASSVYYVSVSWRWCVAAQQLNGFGWILMWPLQQRTAALHRGPQPPLEMEIFSRRRVVGLANFSALSSPRFLWHWHHNTCCFIYFRLISAKNYRILYMHCTLNTVVICNEGSK